MGSPLSFTLASVFLVYFEKNCLQSCSSNHKPHYYLQCVHDIFVLFTSPNYLKNFPILLNGQNANMSVSIENEKPKRISFLDVQIFGENKSFTASVYRKPTVSGVYTHFNSFLSSTYKFGNV